MALALAAAPLGVRDWRMLDAYPAQYVARRLAPSESIAVDGRLDDDAWRSVPWTEGMVDIARQLTLTLSLTLTLILTLTLTRTSAGMDAAPVVLMATDTTGEVRKHHLTLALALALTPL